MKIISSFKDYYDAAQGFGVDLTKAFIRETKEFPTSKLPKEWETNHLVHWYQSTYSGSFIELLEGYDKHPNRDRDSIHSLYVLFAGKMYGGLRFISEPFGKPSKSRYIWTKEVLDETLLTSSLKLKDTSYFNKTSPYEAACKILTVKGDDKLLSWAVNNNISIASIAVNPKKHSNENGGRTNMENPCLKELDFQKVIDPFTAYQELEMFIGGVLSNNSVIPEPTDLEKVSIHGFDKTWSFRKHKLDNTKERKK